MGAMWYAYGFLVFCGLFEYGSPIMCYECNSATNSLCAHKALPDSLRRNCSELDRGIKHTLCRKIIQQVDHEVNGQLPVSRVIRTCGWDETKYKGVCYHRTGYGGRQEVCSCHKDFCNGSYHLTVSTLTIGTVALAVLNLACQ